MVRNRQVSALLFAAGLAVCMALPFVLQAGASFILPPLIALVLCLALAPLADWLGTRGVPNSLASLLAMIVLIAVLSAAGAIVVQPAISMLGDLPAMSGRLAARAEVAAAAWARVAQGAEAIGMTGKGAGAIVAGTGGVLQDLLLQTPGAILEAVLTLMLIYFMLEARLRVRRQLMVDRQDFAGSLRAAQVIREVQGRIGDYFLTTFAVACAVGIIVMLGAMAFGWERPLMWGGLAALLNLLPYIGPLTMIVLLGLFGLAGEASLGVAIAPMLAYGGLHAVEANVISPLIVGRRLSLSPVAILISLIFFSWTWGIAGAFLASPMLLIASVMTEYAGRPNPIGFLLGEPLFLPPPALTSGEGGEAQAG